jgi:hypothetical protein
MHGLTCFGRMNLQRDWTEPIIIHHGTQGWLKLSHAKSPSWPNGTQAKFQEKTQSWLNGLPIKPKHKIEGPS